MKDKNGVIGGFIFCGEVCGFSGVIRSGETYYVPLHSNDQSTTYYRFINNTKKRTVFHNESVTPNAKEMKDINDQRDKL